MSEPGTTTVRDPNLGPPLDDKWWSGIADQILRRFLPYGAGDGPDPDLLTPLSKGLQVVFNSQNTDDDGEGNVRKFLNSQKSPTDRLSDELVLNLTARSASSVQNRLLSQSGGLFPNSGRKSLAVDPARLFYGKSSGSAPPDKPNRPKPRRSGQPDDYWQSLAYAKQSYDTELQTRQDVYDNFLNSFKSREQGKFSKDVNVAVNADAWQARYQMALAISAGSKFSIDDDTYHVSTPIQAPNRSNWIIGELVHAAWQFDYMAAKSQNDILAEFMYSRGGSPGSPAGVRGPIVDYRTLDQSEEAPTLSGSARFAFGKYRPDLIDFTQRSVLEIKPIRAAASGVLQLWRYSHNFNCARYFDELYAVGASGQGRYFLTPTTPVISPFCSHELTAYVDTYLKLKPGANRSAAWADMVRLRDSGKRIHAVPILVPSIPGLILYGIYENEKPGKAEKEQLTEIIKTGLVIVAAVAIVAAIVAVTIATAGSAEAVVAGLAGGATELAAGEVVVDVLGDSLVVSQVPNLAAALNPALANLIPVLP